MSTSFGTPLHPEPKQSRKTLLFILAKVHNVVGIDEIDRQKNGCPFSLSFLPLSESQSQDLFAIGPSS